VPVDFNVPPAKKLCEADDVAVSARGSRHLINLFQSSSVVTCHPSGASPLGSHKAIPVDFIKDLVRYLNQEGYKVILFGTKVKPKKPSFKKIFNMQR
jgi:ADP-heptose:LPS heptosyltransferase